jgi:hypothetical protein
MRIDLKPTEMQDGSRVYAVRLLESLRTGLVGWIEEVPDGWRRFGYHDDPPVLPTSDEAVWDLIEYDSHEQDTEMWPDLGDHGAHSTAAGLRELHASTSTSVAWNLE